MINDLSELTRDLISSSIYN